MHNLDFSSIRALLSTLIGLVLVTLLGVGIRLLAMSTIQQRRERENRQINERLRTLIAAYKTLGGSFTGNLAVDPRHLRDVAVEEDGAEAPRAGSDRSRRVRDAVEAALSDIILLGTEEHVRLAERAARELVAGRPVHTDALVIALRAFIRHALDLDAIPTDLAIPMQGPLRPSGATRGKSEAGSEQGRRGGGGGGGGGGGMGGGGMGGSGAGDRTDPDKGHHPGPDAGSGSHGG